MHLCVSSYTCTIGPPSLRQADVWSDSAHLPVCSPAGQTSGSHDGSGLGQQLTKLVMITDIILNTVTVFSNQSIVAF